MSDLIITENGKQGGIACMASFDPSKGCLNRCEGCYASKTSRIGNSFFSNPLEIKSFDEKKFKSSCKSFINKKINFARAGKHCDPLHPEVLNLTKKALRCAEEEKMKIVVVSKNIVPDKELVNLLKDGGHTLHVSLGMITTAQSNKKRINIGAYYQSKGVNSKYRLVLDVTNKIPDLFKDLICNTIITPMRFPSASSAKLYNVDLSKYEWNGGFYRPLEAHDDFKKFKNWCGEVNGKAFCCSCLVKGK